MSRITLAALAITALGGAMIFTQYNTTMAEGEAQKAMTTKDIKPLNKTDLTDMQKYVTQHDGTEPPFKNEYWDNHEPGIYVDVVSGEPLFSSVDKYDSGTGWPSFTQPIQSVAVDTKTDTKLFLPRTEVRSAASDSHLGHVFDDGPKEKGGKRYCINSAALRFIHKDDLKQEGYEQYLALFDNE